MDIYRIWCQSFKKKWQGTLGFIKLDVTVCQVLDNFLSIFTSCVLLHSFVSEIWQAFEITFYWYKTENLLQRELAHPFEFQRWTYRYMFQFFPALSRQKQSKWSLDLHAGPQNKRHKNRHTLNLFGE